MVAEHTIHENVLNLDVQHTHVWHIPWTRVIKMLPDYWGILSEDEKIRANNMRFETDRNKFIINRGIMRCILGYYTNAQPSKISFVYNLYGKPSLISFPTVDFNLSHSGEMTLLAISRGQSVGIDIEEIRKIPNAHDIVMNFFSEEEVQAYFALPTECRTNSFLRMWTRKEAFLKAIGMGLSIPLNTFTVSVQSDISSHLISIGSVGINIHDWILRDVECGPFYMATIVVEGRELFIHQHAEDEVVKFLFGLSIS